MISWKNCSRSCVKMRSVDEPDWVRPRASLRLSREVDLLTGLPHHSGKTDPLAQLLCRVFAPLTTHTKLSLVKVCSPCQR